MFVRVANLGQAGSTSFKVKIFTFAPGQGRGGCPPWRPAWFIMTPLKVKLQIQERRGKMYSHNMFLRDIEKENKKAFVETAGGLGFGIQRMDSLRINED